MTGKWKAKGKRENNGIKKQNDFSGIKKKQKIQVFFYLTKARILFF